MGDDIAAGITFTSSDVCSAKTGSEVLASPADVSAMVLAGLITRSIRIHLESFECAGPCQIAFIRCQELFRREFIGASTSRKGEASSADEAVPCHNAATCYELPGESLARKDFKRRCRAQWPCFCVSACSCAPCRRRAADWGASAAAAKRPVCAGPQAAHLTCCPPAPEVWAVFS